MNELPNPMRPAGAHAGGAMDEDLKQACYAALAVPRHEARARALDFGWQHVTHLFAGYLVPARRQPERAAPAQGQAPLSSIP